jgi:hypothetical protein
MHNFDADPGASQPNRADTGTGARDPCTGDLCHATAINAFPAMRHLIYRIMPRCNIAEKPATCRMAIR